MVSLGRLIDVWGTPEFNRVAKVELNRLPAGVLPLQQGLKQSSHVSDEPFSVVILNVSETEEELRIKCSVFYAGIIAGCSCADDPTPTGTINEHCEVEFLIDKQTTELSVCKLI